MTRPVIWAVLALSVVAPPSPPAWPGAGDQDAPASPRAASPAPGAAVAGTPVGDTQELAVLARAERRYQAIAAAGGWPTLPADLRLGALPGASRRPARPPSPTPPSAAVLQRLCQRLALEADIEAAACDPPQAPSTYDRRLEDAVRRFQARQGLEVDGVIGAATIVALNQPAEARARQIALNIARRRAEPYTGDVYVRVNIPAYTLTLVEHGRELTLRVITGAVRTPTPEFSAVIRGIDIRPQWRVPDSIYYQEILPKLRRDASLLAKEHYEVVDGQGRVVDPSGIDWRGEARDYRLRQVPGVHNALGLLKFDLPNPHDVYLHDTPGKATFQRHRRAVSHGCIRVQDPLTLAAALMAADPAWPRERLDAAMRGDTSLAVPLPQPVPVHVVYHTVTVEDGDVRFHPDVYSRDVEPAADVPAVGRPVR